MKHIIKNNIVFIFFLLALCTPILLNAALTIDGDFYHIPAHPRHILDVSGAGDTVLSVAALSMAIKKDTKTIAELSNIAGGLVCEAVGVVPIDKDKLLKEYNRICHE